MVNNIMNTAPLLLTDIYPLQEACLSLQVSQRQQQSLPHWLKQESSLDEWDTLGACGRLWTSLSPH